MPFDYMNHSSPERPEGLMDDEIVDVEWEGLTPTKSSRCLAKFVKWSNVVTWRRAPCESVSDETPASAAPHPDSGKEAAAASAPRAAYEIPNFDDVAEGELMDAVAFGILMGDAGDKILSVETVDSMTGVMDKYFNVQDTLNERGSRYGDFTDNARISQSLKHAMECSGQWHTLEPIHKEALLMIAQKIARILNGDPNYADNWHDIQGYARMVEERLPKE